MFDCRECLLDGTDACKRGAGRAVDDSVCDSFVSYHCGTDCPNIQADIADEKFGDGIAADMGLERIKCRDCGWNTTRRK